MSTDKYLFLIGDSLRWINPFNPYVYKFTCDLSNLVRYIAYIMVYKTPYSILSSVVIEDNYNEDHQDFLTKKCNDLKWQLYRFGKVCRILETKPNLLEYFECFPYYNGSLCLIRDNDDVFDRLLKNGMPLNSDADIFNIDDEIPSYIMHHHYNMPSYIGSFTGLKIADLKSMGLTDEKLYDLNMGHVDIYSTLINQDFIQSMRSYFIENNIFTVELQNIRDGLHKYFSQNKLTDEQLDVYAKCFVHLLKNNRLPLFL